MEKQNQKIEITQRITLQDQLDIFLSVRKLSGLFARDVRNVRILFFVLFIIPAFFTVWMVFFAKHKIFESNVIASACICAELLGAVYFLYCVIFAEKLAGKGFKKNMTKSLKAISKKYNFDFTRPQETCTRIQGDWIEEESDHSITKYFLGDYVRNLEAEKFYIIEFTRARYAHFKKDIFSGKSEFDKIIEMIESKKQVITSGTESGLSV